MWLQHRRLCLEGPWLLTFLYSLDTWCSLSLTAKGNCILHAQYLILHITSGHIRAATVRTPPLDCRAALPFSQLISGNFKLLHTIDFLVQANITGIRASGLVSSPVLAVWEDFALTVLPQNLISKPPRLPVLRKVSSPETSVVENNASEMMMSSWYGSTFVDWLSPLNRRLNLENSSNRRRLILLESDKEGISALQKWESCWAKLITGYCNCYPLQGKRKPSGKLIWTVAKIKGDQCDASIRMQ